MTKKLKFLCIMLGLLCIINASPASLHANAAETSAPGEIRGVWVATLYALDYPSSPTTSASALKASADNILNNVQNMGYNTIFLQVRPAGDAIYKSDVFPWSKYLTGTAGEAPSDGFDPLA